MAELSASKRRFTGEDAPAARALQRSGPGAGVVGCHMLHTSRLAARGCVRAPTQAPTQAQWAESIQATAFRSGPRSILLAWPHAGCHRQSNRSSGLLFSLLLSVHLAWARRCSKVLPHVCIYSGWPMTTSCILHVACLVLNKQLDAVQLYGDLGAHQVCRRSACPVMHRRAGRMGRGGWR